MVGQDERLRAAERLQASWETNAASWTRAVREGRIPSRRAGTDDAIVAVAGRLLDARARAAPAERTPRVLDVGCGEGWLSRALAARGAEVLGVDGSEPLIEAAAAHDVPADPAAAAPSFGVATYDELERRGDVAAGPFDLVVCNFALLGDPVAPLLAALARRLAPNGRLLIQTVHPWVAAGDGAYADGWREETFAAFDLPFPATMPWFARTLGSWVAELRAAGLAIVELHEPAHPESGRPLSLLLACAREPAGS